MPCTVGLRDPAAAPQLEGGWLPPNTLQPGEEGLALPPDLLMRAGLGEGDDLVAEVTPDGLRITADRVRKAYVEVTSACNLSCASCIRHSWDETTGHMTVECFERLISELPNRPAGIAPVTVALSGFGEPLLHPHLLTLVCRARERGLRVELITNGTLVDDRLASELAALGVAQVTVSLDGGDAAAYEEMRGTARDPALRAVQALARIRRKARMTVGLAFVVTRRNVNSLPGLLELADVLGLDFVSLSNVAPHTEEMAAEMLWSHAAWAASFKPGGWRPRLVLAPFDVNEVTRDALTALLERSPVFPPPDIATGQRPNHCRFVHEGMLAVAWNGRVAPCLSLLHTHPEYVNGHWRMVRSYTVGHVDERRLADIWRDPAYRDFRRRVRGFDFSPCFACGGCPETDTNDTDCYGSPFPSCSECLWAQGLVLCP